MIKLIVSGTLAITFALAMVASVGAQQPDIRIAQLDCNGNPEVVVIENQGDASQQFAGWKLVSDPPQDEVFDLVVLGGLEPDASVFIQSGSSASGVFKWGKKFIFRNDDPTDYVRLVDDTGAVVDEVACADAGSQPSPTPSPTPEPAAPANVPNGGGRPPVAGGGLSPLMMMLVGGSLAAMGLVAITFPRLQPRRSLVTASSSSRLADQRKAKGGSRRSRVAALSDMALLGIVAAVALLVFGRRRA